jgi:hypothetical protein
MANSSSLLNTEQGRRRAVRFALTITRDTPLAPRLHEQRLLDQFVRGELSIDEVLANLEAASDSQQDGEAPAVAPEPR